jgi:hypothetical protein
MSRAKAELEIMGFPITRENRPALGNQRDCQTVRPLNYENREEIVGYQQNAAIFSEANVRFLN